MERKQGNLKELLDRWSKIEPAKCKYVDEVPKHTDACYRFEALDNSISIPIVENWDNQLQCDKLDYLATIQGAAQEAIESRGMGWRKGMTYIHVVQPEVGYERIMGGSHLEHHVSIALLESYLAAITR